MAQNTRAFPPATAAFGLVDFDQAGTTASIKASYKRIKSNGERHKRVPIDDIDGLKNTLTGLRWTKCGQRKYALVVAAFETCSTDTCSLFILTSEGAIDLFNGFAATITSVELQRLTQLINNKH